MQRLIVKFLGLSAPFAIIYASLFSIAWRTGEAMPVERVVATQASNPATLYNPQRRENIMPFKIYAANHFKPKIIVSGSSRSIQLRDEMFNKEKNILYNLGSFDWRFDKTIELLHLLEFEEELELIILELDPPWFLENNSYEDTQIIVLNSGQVIDLQSLLSTTNTVTRQWLRSPSKLADFWQPVSPTFQQPILGLAAIQRDSAFRADGSIQHGRLIRNTADLERSHEEDKERLAMRTSEFVVGTSFKEHYFEELRAVFEYAEENDIYVLGFTAPYAPYAWDVISEHPDYEYVHQLSKQLTELFDSYGFAYFDFTNPYALDLTIDDFNDGWHSSESAYIRMLLDMVDAIPDVLTPYVDVDALQETLNNAESTWHVFPHKY